MKPTDFTTRDALGMLDTATPTTQLVSATMAVSCSVIAVAGVFAEVLVRKEILTADEAAAVLCEVAAEFRRDGNEENGRTRSMAFTMASDLEKRAAFVASKDQSPDAGKAQQPRLRLVASSMKDSI